MEWQAKSQATPYYLEEKYGVRSVFRAALHIIRTKKMERDLKNALAPYCENKKYGVAPKNAGHSILREQKIWSGAEKCRPLHTARTKSMEWHGKLAATPKLYDRFFGVLAILTSYSKKSKHKFWSVAHFLSALQSSGAKILECGHIFRRTPKCKSKSFGMQAIF